MYTVGTGFVIGLLFGIFHARRLGGSRRDVIHYAISFGILGAIIGLFLSIIFTRLAL